MKNPIKRLAALITAGALLATAAVVGVALPASAHTGDLNVSYACDTTTGEYVGTAVLTISQTGLAGTTNWKVGNEGFEGTPSSNTGLSGAVASTGAGQITLGSFRIPGTTVSKGPWVYAFTTWTDGFTKGSDGQSYQNLAGDCVIPKTPVGTVPTVSATTPTCEANVVTISYSIPEGLSIQGYTGTGSKTAAEFGLAPGDYTYPVDVAEGYTYDGPATVSFTVAPQKSVAECTPPPTFTPTCTTVEDSKTITGTGVLSVDGGWAETWIDVPFTGTLADIGTVLDVTASKTQYLGLHIVTAEGTIVYEEAPGYEGRLWSKSKTWDGVPASFYGEPNSSFGTIQEYIHLNGDVVVTGIRLLYTSDVASTTTVESFTIGCTTYTFVPEPTPVPALFNIAPGIPTCATAGTFDTSVFPITDREGYILNVDRPFDGPGVYTITAVAKPGFTLQGDGTATVTVLPATGFNSDNPESPCYRAVPPESSTNGEWVYEVTCDNEVGDEVDATREVTTVTSTLNTVTGLIETASSTRTEEGTHVVTAEDIEGLECVTPTPTPTPDVTPTPEPTPVVPLALTGGGSPLPWFLGGLALTLAGGLLFGFRRKLFPSKAE